MPISARKQLNELPDDVLTKVTLFYYSDPREKGTGYFFIETPTARMLDAFCAANSGAAKTVMAISRSRKLQKPCSRAASGARTTTA